ncbi:MAG: ECF transporter S component [Clostridia bacterium]|nr:ECF transporter S component [Clostridia bacterium]
MKTNKTNVQRLVGLAILAALVIVLQTFVSIPLGMFTITLTLVPIMLGAILFGPSGGAFLGAVFGVVVGIQVVTGAAGIYSTLMFEYLPFVTILICILKGTVAGFVAGLIYKPFAKTGKKFLGTILSAVSCPIVNTGIFVLGLAFFYGTLVNSWALDQGYANAFTFIMFFMIGLNFVVEFAVNVLLIPVVLRVIDIVKKRF